MKTSYLVFASTILIASICCAQNSQTAPSPELSSDARALLILSSIVEKNVVSAAEAMPADKYSFVPASGEFKEVRSFGAQIKHLAATNHILAASALGEEPPADAGDEAGPGSIYTKNDIVNYAKDSFAHLKRAIQAIDDRNRATKTSAISPLRGADATRIGLITESLIHAYDHYGQMVIYLRMNDVIPPASRN